MCPWLVPQLFNTGEPAITALALERHHIPYHPAFPPDRARAVLGPDLRILKNRLDRRPLPPPRAHSVRPPVLGTVRDRIFIDRRRQDGEWESGRRRGRERSCRAHAQGRPGDEDFGRGSGSVSITCRAARRGAEGRASSTVRERLSRQRLFRKPPRPHPRGRRRWRQQVLSFERLRESVQVVIKVRLEAIRLARFGGRFFLS